MGTFETKFTVPDLARPAGTLNISSVVFANQREPLSAAVGGAQRERRMFGFHPLVQDGQKLIPSITRVYRRDQEMFVYLEVYDPAVETATKSPNIMASLSFFLNGIKAFQTEPVRVDKISSARGHAAPVRFDIPLKELKPGSYTCQVTLIDEVARKFAFARAPMVLIP
jgi:hypothetical protein